MSKHTPGPWIAEQQINLEGKALSMFDIWTNSDKPRYIGEIPREDNARLIAAAPDLLDALQKMLVLYQGKKQGVFGEWTEPVIDARAAIAKATGGKP